MWNPWHDYICAITVQSRESFLFILQQTLTQSIVMFKEEPQHPLCDYQHHFMLAHSRRKSSLLQDVYLISRDQRKDKKKDFFLKGSCPKKINSWFRCKMRSCVYLFTHSSTHFLQYKCETVVSNVVKSPKTLIMYAYTTPDLTRFNPVHLTSPCQLLRKLKSKHLHLGTWVCNSSS